MLRSAPPELPGSHTIDSPLDRSLSLLLAGELEAALRWSAAIVQHDTSVPSSLILTCRLLADAGRAEAAREGFDLGIKRAIDSGNLALAVAAVGDLRKLGVNVEPYLEEIASAFCLGSPRLSDTADPPPPPLPHDDKFQPLSSFLTGPALLSKATGIVHDATTEYALVEESEPTMISPLPLFSAIEKEGLQALLSCFEMITVPAGATVISEGEEGAEAYIVARGELEVRRTPEEDDPQPITLATLSNGALFGEMALLSRAPRAASVVALRPSILLVATRESLEAVAASRPEVGIELAAHCRRRMVENLIRTSPVLANVAPVERAAMVERFETRVFEKGERLIADKEDPTGLHLIASGEVSIVRHEGNEGFIIATLGVGQVVGEVALILRRKASADVVAVHPTVTLHLPHDEFMSLIQEFPGVLLNLYLLAVDRDEETSYVLANSSTNVMADDYILV